MSLPSGMKESRRFLELLDLRQIEFAVAAEARAQVVIAGPVNSGKSTLFNLLKGQQLSAVSAVPGTTTELLAQRFGPFWLVDTPGFDEIAGDPRVASANRAIDGSEVAILVLDAAAGVRQSDADLYRDLRMRGLPTVVVLNKIDLIKKDIKAAVRDAEMKLGVPIIPISAKAGTNVAEKLIPAIIESHPRMAVTVGRALPRFRRVAGRRVIREFGGGGIADRGRANPRSRYSDPDRGACAYAAAISRDLWTDVHRRTRARTALSHRWRCAGTLWCSRSYQADPRRWLDRRRDRRWRGDVGDGSGGDGLLRGRAEALAD